jgi:hypothetical protein
VAASGSGTFKGSLYCARPQGPQYMSQMRAGGTVTQADGAAKAWLAVAVVEPSRIYRFLRYEPYV